MNGDPTTQAQALRVVESAQALTRMIVWITGVLWWCADSAECFINLLYLYHDRSTRLCLHKWFGALALRSPLVVWSENILNILHVKTLSWPTGTSLWDYYISDARIIRMIKPIDQKKKFVRYSLCLSHFLWKKLPNASKFKDPSLSRSDRNLTRISDNLKLLATIAQSFKKKICSWPMTILELTCVEARCIKGLHSLTVLKHKQEFSSSSGLKFYLRVMAHTSSTPNTIPMMRYGVITYWNRHSRNQLIIFLPWY